MEINSVNTHTACSYLNLSSHEKHAPASVTANFSASVAYTADTVAISQTARSFLATLSDSAAASDNGAIAVFDTNQGSMNLDIDDYFSLGGHTNRAASLIQTLPPLLLPTRKNIDALTKHISATFTQFLARNNIPSAPSKITYDNEGQIQLPPDYTYASELKQALASDPVVSRELSTVNALTSHFIEMQKSASFLQGYATAANPAEADAVVAKYSHLFSGNHHYDAIALQFSSNDRLILTHDGKSLI